MEKKIDSPDERLEIRCPRLGHQIRFSYCRIENRGGPCFKILDCWHAHFDIEAHLRRELSQREWQEMVDRPPKPKVLTLVELIAEAKKGLDDET